MLFLAIESCLRSPSVAIGTEKSIIDWASLKEQNNMSKLFVPTIKELFTKNKLLFTNLNAVVIDCGPGSYTGIRIGGVIAKTISFLLKKESYGISSLELLAFTFLQLNQKINQQSDTLVSILGAKSDFLYMATFNIFNGIVRETKSSFLTPIDRFIDNIKNYQNVKIISCDTNLIEKLQCSYGVPSDKLYQINEPTAREVLKLAVKKIENKSSFIDEPLYLRRSYAEEKFEIFV